MLVMQICSFRKDMKPFRATVKALTCIVTLFSFVISIAYQGDGGNTIQQIL